MMDKSLLRDLVKSVIAEEVAAIRKPKPVPAATAEERITIASDADLLAFARRVLSLAGDPAKAKEIAAGRHPFRLERPAQSSAQASPVTAPAPQRAQPTGQSHRIDSGVVTESVLSKLPRGLQRLLLAPGVTVTPLAKDRARSLGLTLERIKP